MTIDIPKRYKEATVEKIPKDLVKKLEELRETRKGLYIHGDVGTGKTFVAYALFREWEEKREEEEQAKKDELNRMSEDGVPIQQIRTEIRPRPYAQFWNMTRLLYELRNEIRNPVEYSIAEDLIERKNLLFIDDIGAEKVSEWVEEVIYLIVNTRYESDIPIIFTSNYPLSGIAEKVGDRVASRIKEMCHIVKLDGEDRRLGK